MAVKDIKKFYAWQRGGILSIQRQDEFRAHLKTMGDVELEVIVRPYRKHRSDNQNRYYHGVVLAIISDHTGMMPDELHEYLKAKFLAEKHIMKTKGDIVVEVEIPGSTASLKTDTMEEYLSKVRMWASAELACYVPEPNEIVEQ